MKFWNINNNSIIWDVEKSYEHQNHKEHIEMSGEEISLILRYGCEKGKLFLEKEIIYPLLRRIPNDTHAHSFQHYYKFDNIKIDGQNINECLKQVIFNGIITLKSLHKDVIEITRKIYPSTENCAVWEQIIIKNQSKKDAVIEICYDKDVRFSRGTKGSYTFVQKVNGENVVLKPNQQIVYDVVNVGYIQRNMPKLQSSDEELARRMNFISKMKNNLVLKTGNDEIDLEFFFSKIRACESIFKNKCGYLHSPGGGSYYAAIWTNDQIEYAAPFFATINYNIAKQASLNAFKLLIPFMNDDFHSIPSSVIAEGVDIWEGVGDRGDSSMYLYGLGRFLLLCGNIELAREFFDSMDWCVQYIKRKINENGVISSDSDELENRFESGNANLCTSCLAFDGLKTAAIIAKELDLFEKSHEYSKMAEELGKNIENFFCSNVMGYDTYRYYEGNDILRAWICIPLTVGIFNRREETVKALISDKLWCEDGVATQSGEVTFWDRATLYALRGIFAGGDNKTAFEYLKKYTHKRLVCDHVPYPVEAYPEGDQRHLSAESALYARIITEGMFGIKPVGFTSFELKPEIPQELESVSLENINIFSDNINIKIDNKKDSYFINVCCNDKILFNDTIKKGEKIIIKK